MIFKADVTFNWDTQNKMYFIVPLTELGTAWLKRITAPKFKTSKMITKTSFEDIYNSALKCQLTTQVIDNTEAMTLNELLNQK